MHPATPTFVTPQQFLASIGSLTGDELRKAKLLYLRNELTSLRTVIASARAFGFVQLLFAIIPIFWPILWLQRSIIRNIINERAELIRNALAIWGDDLGPDRQTIASELDLILR